MQDERTAKVIISADTDDYQKNVKASAEQTNKLVKGLDDLSKKLEGLTKRTGNKLMLFGAADIAAMSAMAAIAGTLQKQMATIEASAANINKSIVGVQTLNVNRLREDIRAVSREVPVSRGEVAQTATAITRMGIPNSASVGQLTDNFIRMGGATGESPIALAQSQIALSRQMGNVGRAPGSIQRYNDVATSLSAQAGTSATGTMDFAQSLSGAARMAGINQTDLMGISTAFTRSGQDGLYAANTFNQIVNEISRIQRTNSPEIKRYASAMGITNTNAMNMNPLDIFEKIIGRVSTSGPEGSRLMEDLGFEGARTQRAIQGVAAEGGVGTWIRKAREEYAQGGAVEAGSEAAFEGLTEQMVELRNRFTDMGQVIGEMVLPKLQFMATAMNKVLGALQPLIEPLLRLGGIGASIAGIGAIGAGMMIKNWAAMSTPALASRVVRSSYLSNLREGMLTGSQTVSGRHSDNTSLRNYEAGRLGPIQRFMFKAGAGIGAYGQETYGQAGIHPIRLPTNLALMGLTRASSWLGKGAADFYRDAALPPDERVKGPNGEERVRPSIMGAFSKNFNLARKSPGEALWGRYGNLGAGGQKIADLSGEDQHAAIRQAEKYQEAFDKQKQWLKDKVGMTDADADRAARTTTKDAPLNIDERVAANADYNKKVAALMSQGGYTKEQAEKQVVTSTANQAQAEAEERAKKSEESKTPWGKLTASLDTLTVAVKELTARMTSASGSKPGAPGTPGAITEEEAAKQKEKASRNTPYTAADQKLLNDHLSRQEKAREVIKKANETSVPRTAKETVKAIGSGIAKTATGAAAFTAGSAGMVAGSAVNAGKGLLGAIGGGWGAALMGVPMAAMAIKSEFDNHGNAMEKLNSADPITEVFASWNQALEASTGKLYKFNAELGSIAPASKDLQESFRNFYQAEQNANGKKEVDFKAIELLKDDRAALVSYIRSQNPTGADADKMAADLYRVLGPEKAKEIMRTVNNPNVKVHGDEVGNQTDVLLGMGDKYATKGQAGFMPNFWSAFPQALETNLPLGRLSGMMHGAAAAPYEDMYADPEFEGTKVMEAAFAEQNRAFSDFAENYDTGKEGDKTSESYNYLELKKEMANLMVGANTPEGLGRLNAYMSRLGQQSYGSGLEYDASEASNVAASGDGAQMNEFINRTLGTTAAGEGVAGMSQEEIVRQREAAVKDPWGASNRKYYDDVSSNVAYQAWMAQDDSVANQQYGSGLSRLQQFAASVASSDTLKAATGEKRDDSQAQMEAINELVAKAKQFASDGNEQKAFLDTMVESQAEGSPMRVLAESAKGIIDQEGSYKTATMNTFGQLQKTFKDVEDYINQGHEGDTNYKETLLGLQNAQGEAVTGGLQAMQQYDRSYTRGEEDYGLSKKRAAFQNELSIERSRTDYEMQRRRSATDYRVSNEREEADYLRSRKRSHFEFELAMTRNQNDFQRQRSRSNKDYNIAMERQLQTTTKNIMNPFQRQDAVAVSDPGTLIWNLGDQNNIFKELMKNVDKLKAMGMTQETIDNLGLSDINNWQQTKALAESITKGQVRKINAKMGRRKKLVGDLTQDGDYNRDYRWQTEDRRKQLGREDRDFERSVNHQVKDYRRGLRQQREDHDRMINRRERDWNKSLRRQEHDYERSLNRQERDWRRSLRWQEKDHKKQLDRMKEDFIGFGDETGKDMNAQMEEYQRISDKYFKGETLQLDEYMRKAVNNWDTLINDAKARSDALEVGPDTAETPDSGKPQNGDITVRVPGLDKPISIPGLTMNEGQTKINLPFTDANIPIPGLAEGGVINSKTLAWIGEHGQEAVIPLQGDVLSKALHRAFKDSMARNINHTQVVGDGWGRDDRRAAKAHGVAGRGMTPDEGKYQMRVINHSNTFRDITVISQDPDDMAKKLKHKARMRSMIGSKT